VGLKGILRSGGFRARYRMRMNDGGEFDYARNVVYEALNEVGRRHNLPPVARSLTTYVRKNLGQFLKDTVEMSRAYCACLSISSDHPKQWETYAEEGKGFAIGINLLRFLNNQQPAVRRGEPYVLCAPVIYNEADQRDLVWRLVEAGIRDLQTFAASCSQQSVHLTALRDRVTQEIVVHLIVLTDFLKTQIYSSEREFRLMLDANDGTLEAPHIQQYEREDESTPFIFLDLRSPKTGRLTLAEIKVGPRASFPEEKAFLEELLDELGYGSNQKDRPQITQSLVAMDARI
ncbi:MAG: DUF2971 domain-containing protein, partial [Bacteroidota bacterium]